MKRARPAGKVHLIGVPPGDPGLLTRRGRDILRTADFVLYDETVEPFFLPDLKKSCEAVFAGETDERPALNAEQLCDLLVRQARKGRSVARLRGGDPYLMGRGAQEALHCHNEGVDFEIVPGISLITVAASYAGIPLLQRGLARSLHISFGPFQPDQDVPAPADTPASLPAKPAVRIRRRKPGEADEPRQPSLRARRLLSHQQDGLWVPAPAESIAAELEGEDDERIVVDWGALAAAADTLVFASVEGCLETIRAGLIRGGRAAGEPVAILSAAATAQQNTHVTTLGNLGVDVPVLVPPVLLVVGDVVALREHLNIHEQKPLFGVRVGLVHTDPADREVVELLFDAGARVTHHQVMEEHPVEGLAEELEALKDDLASSTAIVFPSPSSVRCLLAAFHEAGMDMRALPARARLIPVGHETARLLEERSLRVDPPLDDYTPGGLLRRLDTDPARQRVLLFGEPDGGDFAAALRKKGLHATAVPLYERRPARETILRLRDAIEGGNLDALVLLSHGALRLVIERLGEGGVQRLLQGIPIATAEVDSARVLTKMGLKASCPADGPAGCRDVLVELSARPGRQPVARPTVDDDESW